MFYKVKKVLDLILFRVVVNLNQFLKEFKESVEVIFAKIHLITSEHNCSYSPFLSAKTIFVDFIFGSKIKKMTLLLNIH